jgi:hypothetical protein
MAVVTHPAFAKKSSGRGLAATAALAVLFWALAAVLVFEAHRLIEPLSLFGGALCEIAAIVLAALAYMRLAARGGGVDHALGVGITWLVFAVISEIAVTMHFGHGWHALLGSPDRPLLRNVFLFVWMFAPAFFVRREDRS